MDDRLQVQMQCAGEFDILRTIRKGGDDGMSVRLVVTSQFEQVAKEQNKHLVALADETPLLDSGLDSLCFAIIVARLEDELGVDPFSTSEDTDFPVTFGDFIRFYENAAK